MAKTAAAGRFKGPDSALVNACNIIPYTQSLFSRINRLILFKTDVGPDFRIRVLALLVNRLCHYMIIKINCAWF